MRVSEAIGVMHFGRFVRLGNKSWCTPFVFKVVANCCKIG